VALIDHQGQMLFGTGNFDRRGSSTTRGIRKAARVFDVPVVLTTVETKSFSGNMWPQLRAVFPGKEPIERFVHELLGRQELCRGHRKDGTDKDRAGRDKVLVVQSSWTNARWVLSRELRLAACGPHVPLKDFVSTVVKTTGTSNTLAAFPNATVLLMIPWRRKLPVPKQHLALMVDQRHEQLSGVKSPFSLSFGRLPFDDC